MSMRAAIRQIRPFIHQRPSKIRCRQLWPPIDTRGPLTKRDNTKDVTSHVVYPPPGSESLEHPLRSPIGPQAPQWPPFRDSAGTSASNTNPEMPTLAPAAFRTSPTPPSPNLTRAIVGYSLTAGAPIFCRRELRFPDHVEQTGLAAASVSNTTTLPSRTQTNWPPTSYVVEEDCSYCRACTPDPSEFDG